MSLEETKERKKRNTPSVKKKYPIIEFALASALPFNASKVWALLLDDLDLVLFYRCRSVWASISHLTGGCGLNLFLPSPRCPRSRASTMNLQPVPLSCVLPAHGSCEQGSLKIPRSSAYPAGSARASG